ncbi:shikimate dehydrogenase [Thalassotalea profundi]|uniref:Shikimate dehydrogenase (NADP(+)) n=1 Tax=Thalassotalea profundi TaxID=2036687 RepID=A0ABQ3IZ79_9GAMM|nr:shikimate dehydrogenase [Thalassotalea profundi]GHE96489.1 shikimate dehydrogenase (NADP(+)) [Thalassotalea profundi]
MDHYRVYGNPIQQSKSPIIHNAFAIQTAQSIQYDKQLVKLNEFEHVVKTFILEGGKGANVTAPFKEQACQLCDHLSDRAKLSGAVNTLSFHKGEIFGDNTDGLGLVQDLISHQVKLANKKILLLGAGGAAKGVVYSLLEQKPELLIVANRTVAKAQLIVDQYPHENIKSSSFDDTSKFEFDVIINATSAGLSGESVPIPKQIIKAKTICYDMVYGKALTPFLKMAQELGAAQVIDGLGMLVGQAAESFYIWRNVKPETDNIMRQLRAELS